MAEIMVIVMRTPFVVSDWMFIICISAEDAWPLFKSSVTDLVSLSRRHSLYWSVVSA